MSLNGWVFSHVLNSFFVSQTILMLLISLPASFHIFPLFLFSTSSSGIFLFRVPLHFFCIYFVSLVPSPPFSSFNLPLPDSSIFTILFNHWLSSPFPHNHRTSCILSLWPQGAHMHSFHPAGRMGENLLKGLSDCLCISLSGVKWDK